MSSTRMKLVAALLLWSSVLRPCHGARSDDREDSYSIDLVVTRHGLSCANIVSDFSKPTSMGLYDQMIQAGGHRNIADPILARAGMHGTLEMRRVTQDFKPDAVLASPLLRAIETAVIQYPSDTLHIVPWIREVSAFAKGMLRHLPVKGGEGADNLPTPLVQQKERLKQELNTSKGLLGVRSVEDIEFVDWTKAETRLKEHDWKKFKTFLGAEFLPFLIPTLKNKPPGSTITLAVVTHSNFMRSEDDIQKPCGKFWAANGKPWNNQAVKISYDAIPQTLVKSPSLFHEVKAEADAFQTVLPVFALAQKNGCSVTAGGVPYTKRALCLKDIGENCEKDIRGQHLSLPELLETTIAKKKAKQEKIAQELVKRIVAKVENLPKVSEDVDDQETYFKEHVKPLQDEERALKVELLTLNSTRCISD